MTTKLPHNTPSTGAARGRFFFLMSVLLLAFVIVGFAPTLFLRPLSDLSSLPVHLHIHGVALTGWYIWLVVQTSLVQGGRTATHQRTGIVGALIGGVCVIAGPLATMGAVRSLHSIGLDWDTDMSAHAVFGIEGISMELFAAQLVFGNLASILTFAGMLVLAILLRRNVVAHKRLMLLASISIIGPALARISRWPTLGGEDGAFIPVVFFGLLLALIAHDWVTERRVHRVTWAGALATVLIFFFSQFIASTPIGSSVVRSMA